MSWAGKTILIVDDEADIRGMIRGILEDEGYKTRMAANAQQAYETLEEMTPALIILDIWLHGSAEDGLEILEKVKADCPHIPVLMISGHGTVETAVSAIKKGAYDFIEKPFKSDRLLLMMERALETASLRMENQALKQKTEGPSELVGSSHALATIKQAIARVAPTNSRVLITGEAGTGKDIVARLIHKHSKRAGHPFLTLNCAILHPERLEQELFGEEGETVIEGVLEQANGGTLFLDEVADMPLETQGKIVRVLQDQRFHRLKGTQSVEVDVRIIAATNKNLEAAMERGDFRQDLYYRLNVVPVVMPPLKNHTGDIAELVAYFVQHYARQSGLYEREFTTDAIAALQNHEWPGNVRQLRNIVESVMIMTPSDAEDAPVDVDDLPPEISGLSPQKSAGTATVKTVTPDMMTLPLREAREKFEKSYLSTQIARFEGNISKTAQFVGMERSALHRKIKSLDIDVSNAASNDDVPAPLPVGQKQ